jgi:inositol phosphorylceramide mannosyltransferase catalytic subunit
MHIPARIIQTGKDRNLSLTARAAATNLKLLHPEWEYRFFDDEEVERFIDGEFPQHRAIYDGFPKRIQRFDFFRYLAVYRFGGFYFDLDVFLSEKLNTLLNCHCVFPFEEITLNRFLRQKCGIDWEIGNYAFGAVPGSPFLAAVIENCVRAQRDPAWSGDLMKGIPSLFRTEFEVLNTTGPGLITRTLAENPSLAKDVTVLFPPDVCDDESWHQFGNFGIHLMEGSWRTKGNFLWRRLAWRWEARARQRFLPESRRLGRTRRVPGT